VSLIIRCEIMESGEVFAGTHIQVVGGTGIKNSIDCGYRSRAYRSRGEAGYAVGVVGAWGLEM